MRRRRAQLARAAAQGGGADGGAGRLHQRRQDDAVQRADRRRRGRVERAVRHARSAGPPVRLPDRRELLVSDTVGFIDRLPHSLVAAFRATLEEVADADLLVHVIDASNPERERQMAAVRTVLGGSRRRHGAVARGLQQVRPHSTTASGRGSRAHLPGRAVRLGAHRRRPRRPDRRHGSAAGARHRRRVHAGVRRASEESREPDRAALSARPDSQSRQRRRPRLHRGGRAAAAAAAVQRSAVVRHEHRSQCRVCGRDRWAALVVGLFLCLGLAGACAQRSLPRRPPGPATAPQFPDFVLPAAPAGLGTPAAVERHQRGLAVAAGRRSARRGAQLRGRAESDAGFYPAEAGLGYAALARKDHDAALPAFRPRAGRQPALRAGAGRARRGAARARRARSRRSTASKPRSLPTRRSARCRAASTCSACACSQDDVAAARKAAEAGQAGPRRGRAVPARHCRLAAEPVPLPRAGRRRAAGQRSRGRARARRRRPVELDPADAAGAGH